MTARLVALAVFSLLAGAVARPSVAAPSESERQARRSFQDGEAHFRAGRFAEALAAYQAGYDQVPLPGFLINIAQCQRRLGDLRKARATYQKFVMVAPDSPHAPEVKALITELDKLVAELDGDGSPPPEKATSPPVLEPKPPVLSGTAAAPEVTASSPLLLTSTPPAPRESAPPRHRWWLWALAGAALTGAGATIAAFAISPSATTIREGSLATLRR